MNVPVLGVGGFGIVSYLWSRNAWLLERAMGVLLAAIILTGCAVTPEQVTVAGPPEYRTGYAAGCNSGFSAAGNPYYNLDKDPQRFLDDRLYAEGWNDGYGQCKGEYESFRRR